MKSKFSVSKIFCRRFFVIILACIIFSESTYAATYDTLIARKNALSMRLDSLEIEKQRRKRKGESLDELEKISQRIQDSILLFRAKLENISESDAAFLQKNKKQGVLYNLMETLLQPSTLFDWIIIVIGFITLLSGIVLIISVLHSFKQHKKRKTRERTLKSVIKKSEPSIKKNQTPDLETVEKISNFSNAFPPHTTPENDMEDKNIAMLRERMQKDIENIQRFNKSTSPFSSRIQQTNDPEEKSQDNESLKELVITAARQGLTVDQISQKYHISKDQVALIVRLSKK